jgi:hypothetical protein
MGVMMDIKQKAIVECRRSLRRVKDQLSQGKADPFNVLGSLRYLERTSAAYDPSTIITLGMHPSADAYREAFAKENCYIDARTESILSRQKLELSSSPCELVVVTRTVADLGFSQNASEEEICIRANLHGLSYALYPSHLHRGGEALLALRLAFRQPPGSGVIVPLWGFTDEARNRYEFILTNESDARWIRSRIVRSKYPPDARMAFCLKL